MSDSALPLLDLDEAKAHLHRDDDSDDVRITTLLAGAISWTLGQCDVDAPPEGAETDFKTAAVLRLRDIYDGVGTGPETDAARNLLSRWRVLAC